MTNIAIIGLGLMGASFAKKLTRLNYNVYGIDVSQQTIDKAKELKIIVDGSTNPLDVISKCDTFIFCLYPTKILPWIEVYQNDIPKNSLLMDISGVKTNIVKPIQDVLREDLELLSIHPMCGLVVLNLVMKRFLRVQTLFLFLLKRIKMKQLKL